MSTPMGKTLEAIRAGLKAAQVKHGIAPALLALRESTWGAMAAAWNAEQAGRPLGQVIPRGKDRGDTSLFGMRVVTDETVPVGVLQLRDRAHRTLGLVEVA